MPKVLILRSYHEPYAKRFDAHGISYKFCDAAFDDKERIIKEGQDCDAILFTGTYFTEDLFAALPNLKIISRGGIGIDRVDLEAATRHHVIVCNSATYGTYDVAEHTVSLILSLMHSIPRFDRALKDANNWGDEGIPYAHRLKERTLGIIGFGRISKWVCQMMSGFRMNILVYDPYASEASAKELGVKLVSLDELTARSHIISVNAPLTRETHHIIDADLISHMKDGVLIVNTSRGPLIDEAALIQALESGKVGGAALDVFEEEPFPDDCRLRKFPQVVLTPHVAWRSAEAVRDLTEEVTGNIIDYFEGRPLSNALNLR